MFGLFRKKQEKKANGTTEVKTDLRNAVAPFITSYETFSDEISEGYSHIDHNPTELRFFAMAATSVFVQAFGDFPQEKMQALVGMFYEQSSANLLLFMPQLDFSLVHGAATQRFTDYADLIVEIINADTEGRQQDANLSLMTALDKNLRVERGAFDRSMQGLSVASALVRYAAEVRDAALRVGTTF